MAETERLRAVISGRVQGVGFRAFVIDRASRLDLNGWVRNTYEGDVEVLAEGPRAALAMLLGELRSGPRGAYVTGLKEEWQPATGEFSGFDVLRTA
jgi:acylphosphatase